MDLITLLKKEMEAEAAITRKMLVRVPEEKFDWQPHPKSMSLKMLATHIAELPGWVQSAVHANGIDFAVIPYKPQEIASTGELLDFFEEKLGVAREALKTADVSTFNEEWVLRDGDKVFLTSTKYEMLRTTFCQIVHHRAQLGVYFRLLDIPVPASYGPSADEPNF